MLSLVCMLLHPRKFKGIFRFPSIDAQYAGILHMSSSKENDNLAKLTIEYVNIEDGIRIDRLKKSCKVVHGIIEENIEVTLMVNNISPSSRNNIFTFNILIDYVFWNLNLNTQGDLDMDLKFDQMTIHFTNIHSWIGYFTIYKDSKNQDPSFCFLLNDNIKISFHYSMPLSTFENRIENLGNLYVQLSSNSPKPLSEFLMLVHTIQDFLNFFYHNEVLIDALYGKQVAKTDTIAIFYKSVYPEKMNKLGPVAFNFAELFSSTKIIPYDTNRFPTVIKKWFELSKDPRRGLILDYFFARMYDHGSYQEGLFLSLCGFVESYYKYNLSNVDLDKRNKREEYIGKVEPCLEKLRTEEYGSKLYNHILGFKNIPFQEMIKSSCLQNLDVAAFWSLPIYYFDLMVIQRIIKKYPSKRESQKIIEEIIIKAKNIREDSDRYIKCLQLNCLKIELNSHPGIVLKLQKFAKYLFYNEFPREIAKYRNEFAHGNFNIEKRENWEQYEDKIEQLVKVLHFISYLCILSELGFNRRDLIRLFNLDAPNVSKLASIFGISL